MRKALLIMFAATFLMFSGCDPVYIYEDPLEVDRALVAVTSEDGIFLTWRLRLHDWPDIGFNVYKNGVKLNSAILGPAHTDFLDEGASSGSYRVEVLSAGRSVEMTPAVTPWASNYKKIPLEYPAQKFRYTLVGSGTTTTFTAHDGVAVTRHANLTIEPYTMLHYAFDGAPVDLNGDGNLDLVFMWFPQDQRDSSHNGYSGNVLLDAYSITTGEKLWGAGKFVDFGPNIRGGNHDNMYSAYDFSGRGIADIMTRTVPLSMDTAGNVLGPLDAEGNIRMFKRNLETWVLYDDDDVAITDESVYWYANSNGVTIAGAEYLSVICGETGVFLDTIMYPVPRVLMFGNPTQNQWMRFITGTAYLDGPGSAPSGIFQRGYYSGYSTTIAAVDWDGEDLSVRWIFSSNAASRTVTGTGITGGSVTIPAGTYTLQPASAATNPAGWGSSYTGQGNHSLTIVSPFECGRQIIVLGGMAVDWNGVPMWRTGQGHGDANHQGNLWPDRPGTEIFMVHEDSPGGMSVVSIQTGEVLWRHPVAAGDTGRGMAGSLEPDMRGFQVWGQMNGAFAGTNHIDGTRLSENIPVFGPGVAINTIDWANQSGSNQAGPVNYAIYWDGDTGREALDGGFQDFANGEDIDPFVLKGVKLGEGAYEMQLVDRFVGMRTNSGTKQVPILQADLFGDWREEIIFRDAESLNLYIFTTTHPTVHTGHGAVPASGIPTLWDCHDYRAQVLGQHGCYNQPPWPRWYIGYNMDPIRQ